MKCDVCGTEMSCVILDWYCPNEDKHNCGPPVASLPNIGLNTWVWRGGDVVLTVHREDHHHLTATLEFIDNNGQLKKFGPLAFLDEEEISHWLVRVKETFCNTASIRSLPDKVHLT